MYVRTQRHLQQIKDEEILRLIKLGLLFCDKDGSAIYRFHGRRYGKLKPFYDDQQRQCVRVWIGGRRKGTTAARIVWMCTHMQLIPEDMEVDHIDHNRHNNHPDNLRLRDWRDNRSDNGNGVYVPGEF